jgi:hypothetical protein
MMSDTGQWIREQKAKAEVFRALHESGTLVLPNACCGTAHHRHVHGT